MASAPDLVEYNRLENGSHFLLSNGEVAVVTDNSIAGDLLIYGGGTAAVAEVRSLVTPVAAQTVSVSRGVESHSSLAPIAARRAHETLDAMRVLIAPADAWIQEPRA